MKYLAVILTIWFFIPVRGYGQKLSKKQAWQILNNADRCLRTSDTSSFLKLYYTEAGFTEQDVMSNFKRLQTFLDTAFAQNFPIECIEISRTKKDKNTDTVFSQYEIDAFYRYSKNYSKCMGLNVYYTNNTWLVRDLPYFITRTEQAIPKGHSK